MPHKWSLFVCFKILDHTFTPLILLFLDSRSFFYRFHGRKSSTWFEIFVMPQVGLWNLWALIVEINHYLQLDPFDQTLACYILTLLSFIYSMLSLGIRSEPFQFQHLHSTALSCWNNLICPNSPIRHPHLLI